MCTRPFDRNIYCFFVHDHSTKNLFNYFICSNHLIKTCGALRFIITFEDDHWTKVIRVLIYIFISFANNHSIKIRGHSYSLIYLLINCVNFSYATFMAVLIYSVHCIDGGTALIFRTLCPWLYEVFAFFIIKLIALQLC